MPPFSALRSALISCCLLVFLGLNSHAQVQVQVERLGGKPLSGTFLGFNDGGELRLGGSDEPVLVSEKELISVDFAGSAIRLGKGMVRVQLLNGDIIIGSIEGGNYDTVTLRSAATGPIEILLDVVAELRWLDLGKLPPLRPRKKTDDGLEDDELFMLKSEGRLDPLPGELQRIETNGVVFSSAAGDDRSFSFLRDRVAVVRLALGEELKAPAGRFVTISLRDGSQVSGALIEASATKIKVKLMAGPTVHIDSSMVGTLAFKNDSFRWLADMDPVEVKETPFLEGARTFGLQRNQGFGTAQQLKIGAQSFARGVGMHARTRASWKLNGAYALLEAKVGVDPATGSRAIPGSVRLRVYADGQVVWKSDLLVAGQAPVAMRIDGLEDCQILTLETDFGDSMGTGARGVFGDIIVTKP